jgi:hypothetical protein
MEIWRTVACLFVIVFSLGKTEKRPLICKSENSLGFFEIKHDYSCDSFQKVNPESKIKGCLIVWKENHFQSKTNAVICKREMVTKCERYSNIFPWSATEELPVTKQFILIDQNECEILNQTHFSPHGQLQRVGSYSWSTQNEIKRPSLSWLDTKIWKCVGTINDYMINSYITRIDEEHILSPDGSMAVCHSYHKGKCTRPDNSSIIWVPNEGMESKFVPFVNVPASGLVDLLNKTVLLKSDNNKLAVAFDQKIGRTKWLGCSLSRELDFPCSESECDLTKSDFDPSNVEILHSHQGIIYSFHRFNIVEEKGMLDKVKGFFTRSKREIAETEFVAAQLQAAFMIFNDESMTNLKNIAYTMCLNMELNSRYLMSLATDERGATMIARAILKMDDIKATVAGNYLQVSHCVPVDDWHFIPMNDTCSRGLPLAYHFNKNPSTLDSSILIRGEGYMDPDTRIITETTKPEECSDSAEILVDLDPPFLMNGPTAKQYFFKSKGIQLYPTFNGFSMKFEIIIPEGYGVKDLIFKRSPTMEENFRFVEEMKKIWRKLDKDTDETNNPKVDLKTVFTDFLLNGVLGLFVPTFDNHPLLRLLMILVSIYVVIQLTLQVLFPLWISTFCYRNLGFGRIIAKTIERRNVNSNYNKSLIESPKNVLFD